MSESYKPILDREGVGEDIRQHLHEPIGLLQELVDYGTALIPRAFDSSPKDFQATYLIFVQLQQFVANLDAAQELLSKGCCYSASLQVRSLLESYMMLKWILESDTAKKIDHLFVANLRKRRSWQAIAVPGSPEANKHPDEAKKLPKDPKIIAGITKEIANIDALLSDPRYAAINAAFDTARGKRDYDPNWYELFGVRSIRAITIANGRQKEYDFIYSPFSGATHGGDIWKSIHFHPGQVEVNSIREVQGVPLLCKLSATYAMHVYQHILETYRPGEVENYRRKYLTEWRTRFQKEFKFEIRPEFIVI
jgi:Family of unknown function (DUF5677)